MMMTSESSSQGQIEMEEEEEVLEGEIQTITSCHSNTEREMHRLQPVENETSENYDTGTQVLDDGQEGRMTLNELGFQTFLGHQQQHQQYYELPL